MKHFFRALADCRLLIACLASVCLLSPVPCHAALQTINLGAAPNDGTGDGLRTAFTKVNTNVTQLDAKKVEGTNGNAYGLTIHGGNMPIVYTNLAQLLAGAETNKVLHALGHTTVTDRGGGDFYYDPNSTEATNLGTIFTGPGGGRYKRRWVDTIHVDWFGAKGDDSAIDTVPIQSAINFALSNNVAKVLFTSGKTYKVDDILIVGATNASGVWQFRGNLTLASSAGHNFGGIPINVGARITQSSSNLALFALQYVRGVTIEGLELRGKNEFNLTPVQTLPGMLRWTNYVVAPVSTNRYSPHAAIIIDPFQSSVAHANRYPGALTNYYTATSGGSVQVTIRSCAFNNWFKAIDNAGAQNGDSIQIEKNLFTACTFALTTGNSQARGCTFNDNLLSHVWLLFTTKFSGDGVGVSPSFQGNECTFVSRLFDVDLNRGQFTCTGLYAESLASIGIVGGGSDQQSAIFNGGNFSTIASSSSADAFFYAATAAVIFNGVTFSGNTPAYTALRFYTAHNSGNSLTDGRITFLNCSFLSTTNGIACNDPAQVRMINSAVSIVGGGLMQKFSDQISVGTASSPDTFDGRMVWPGTYFSRGVTNYFVPPNFFTYTVGGTARFNGDGTGTVSNLTSLARVKVGDLLYAESDGTFSNSVAPFNLNNPIVGTTITMLNFGSVTNIDTATGIVYFHGAPLDFGGGGGMNNAVNVTIGQLQRFKMHAYTTGAIGTGVNTITNVSPISSWAVGDLVRGDGIVDGTIITNISGTTITVSQSMFPARAAPLSSEIYEARLVQLNTGADALLTAPPAGGNASTLKLGSKEISLTVTANTTNAVRVEIGGTKYWLMIANETPP